MKDLYIITQPDKDGSIPDDYDYLITEIMTHDGLADETLHILPILLKDGMELAEVEEDLEDLYDIITDDLDEEYSLIFNLNGEYQIMPANPEVDDTDRIHTIDKNFNAIYRSLS